MSISETLGLAVSFRKTVSESDVYLFAGITGDFSANHVGEAFMKTTVFGDRIAHGVCWCVDAPLTSNTSASTSRS